MHTLDLAKSHSITDLADVHRGLRIEPIGNDARWRAQSILASVRIVCRYDERCGGMERIGRREFLFAHGFRR